MNIYNQFKAILVLTAFSYPCFAGGMEIIRENYIERSIAFNNNISDQKIPRHTNNINNVLNKSPLERIANDEEKEAIVKAQMATSFIHGTNKDIQFTPEQLNGPNGKHFWCLQTIQEISNRLVKAFYKSGIYIGALNAILDENASPVVTNLRLLFEYSKISAKNLRNWFMAALEEHGTDQKHINEHKKYWHNIPDSSSSLPSGPILDLEDFGWTPQIQQTIGTLTANPEIDSIMSIYDPSTNSYGEFSEVGMKLAFIEWEASQLGKPRMGFLGTNVGYFQFALNGIPTNNTIPGQKHHNTLQTFYGNANDAFKKGFNSYAGVVRTSGSSGGHYFTLFATKSASGWDVAAINPLGMPGSKDSAAKEALNPFVEFLKSKGETVHSQQAIAAGLQAGNSTCGFWATIMARALCSEGPTNGLENLYNWLMQQDPPSPENLETLGSAPAQSIKLDQILALKEIISLQQEQEGLQAAIAFESDQEAINNAWILYQQLGQKAAEKRTLLGPDEAKIIAHQNDLEIKLHDFEQNFSKYFITLMQVLVNKSIDSGYNEIADPHHRTGTTQAQLNQYDEHIVTPACKELHKNFVEAIKQFVEAIKQNVYTTK